ncbi:Aurora kinase A and ninein-interacting protein [Channa argus]|uniref:Aurora kinase A and ninein-interacting protein n=1 Tax=Channa argus TaxID=215402 RepID=A0A6G1QYQ9_CHAAH|nr:Aurora kinase A and ninein-interacting protein [Channa argus]KAK2921085.1 hypothetical protein Q8A73_000570 [Channa argus]
MKTSKPALQTSAQEECGVWLDTLQLKEKAKRKRLARPVSKLLNPFAEGEGYSLAVALNFTQTKMEMPKTKQSSISTFFTSHRRVLNKMSTSEVPKMDLVRCSYLSTSTVPTLVTSGTKRRREADLEKSDICKPESGLDHDCRSENVTIPKAALGQEHCEASHTPEEHCDVFKTPQSKRRVTDLSLLAGDSQLLPQAWSQDPLLTSSQYSDSEFYVTNQKKTTAKNLNNSETRFFTSLESDTFGFRLDLKGRTSTQKSLELFNFPQMDHEKENSSALTFNSPKKPSSFSHPRVLSNPKWTETKTVSPQKHITDQQWKTADKEEIYNSLSKCIKLRNSPFKKRVAEQQSRELDEDSLAMLFTQDSEGFRVIAHRGLHTRSPLKDQTNVSCGTVNISAYKPLEDEEDEMLFTQDSEGNQVIKH